jgi:nucleotide-binding universal stress UspA family protein
MYKRILTAVDGSEPAELALAEAIHLAAEQGAELRVVHLIDTTLGLAAEPGFYSETYEKTSVEEGRRILDAAVTRARSAGVAVHGKLVEALTAQFGQTLVHEGTLWGADLLVVGTHGRRGVSRLLLGSVAEAVVRHATTPVLLVRAPAR